MPPEASMSTNKAPSRSTQRTELHATTTRVYSTASPTRRPASTFPRVSAITKAPRITLAATRMGVTQRPKAHSTASSRHERRISPSLASPRTPWQTSANWYTLFIEQLQTDLSKLSRTSPPSHHPHRQRTIIPTKPQKPVPTMAGGRRRGGKQEKRKGFKKIKKKQKKFKHGTVRLINKERLPDRGRVEIHINGEWGTICNDMFDSRAAGIVCRQLGFPFVLKVAKRAEFGQGADLRILLDDVRCTGMEKTLLECRRSKIGQHNCDHDEDVGVVCSHKEEEEMMEEEPV